MKLDEEQKQIKQKINAILEKYFTSDVKKLNKIPQIMNKEYVDYVISSTGKWIIIAFLQPESMQIFDKYYSKYNDPFPGLIIASDTVIPIAFEINNSNYGYYKNISIKNSYSFKVKNDCSFILENYRQMIDTADEHIEYIIDLAYVITFTDKVNLENFYDPLDSLIKYSLTIWSSE